MLCYVSAFPNIPTSSKDGCWFIKVTACHVCSLTGYQIYKKKCGGGNANAEAALEGDQEKAKDFALDNHAYENDDYDGDKEKVKDSDKNTKL